MALITKIRRNFWIVLLLVGLAMAAFILMDINSASSLGGGQTFNIGQIGDKKIEWNEFQNAESILYAGSAGNVYARREGLWNHFIKDALVKEEAEDLGLIVTEDEMQELQFGANISPVIQRNFSDPRTGQMNIEALNNFRQGLQDGSLPPQSINFWNFQENQIRTEELQSKINTMVLKGMYLPEWEVEKRHFENNDKMDFAYVSIPYDDVEDGEVTVTDEDLEAYIKDNPGLYTNEEETRNIVYVAFDVLPTAQDSTDLLTKISEAKEEFGTTEEDSLFAVNNYGLVNETYYKANALSDSIQKYLVGQENGTMYGPYIEAGEYKVAKLIDSKRIPDSVEVRHILLTAQNQEEGNRALALIDSIKTAIEGGGTDFATMARRYSQDSGSGAKGGDLGYTAAGAMVPEFNDLIFYKAETGELNEVVTQFGIHLVEVTDKKYLSDDLSYKIYYLREPIVPSQSTQDEEYDKVLEFISANRSYAELENSVNASDDLGFEVVTNLTANSYEVPGLGAEASAREMVQWAFESSTEVGNVAPDVYIFQDAVNYVNNKYVVVALTAINEPGLATVASVRDEIEGKVRNLKKGEAIKSRITGTELSAIAAQFGTRVDTARGAVFTSGFIPNVGSEPAVIGTAFGTAEQATSGPIMGNTGVYVIKNLGLTKATEPSNYLQMRKIHSSQFPTRVNNDLLDAMKKNMKIEDNRSQYF